MNTAALRCFISRGNARAAPVATALKRHGTHSAVGAAAQRASRSTAAGDAGRPAQGALDTVPVTTLRVPAGAGGGVLVYDVYGDDDRQPVVFLHGGGQTRWAWEQTCKRVALAGYTAVALDMKGHGEAYWDPAGDYASKAFAEDVDRMLSMSGLNAAGRRPVLVGASLGGLTALMTDSLKDETTCGGLVLVDIAPRMEMSGVNRVVTFMIETAKVGFASLDEAADAVAQYLPHRKRGKNLESLQKNLRVGDDGRYRWHWDPAFFEERALLTTNNHSEESLAAASVMYHEQARRIPESVPALLIRGAASDMVSDRSVREFLEAVPHAKFVDVSDADHMVAGDRNDVFASAVIEFLSESARVPMSRRSRL